MLARLVPVLLALAVGAGLYFLFSHLADSGFRWGVFASVIRGIHPGWLILSLACMLLTYPGRALRWRVMMIPVRPDVSFGSLLSATVIGFTAVVFFGRPGEFVRPWLISVREKVPFSSQLAAWFLERILDLLSVVLLFGFALTRLTGLPASPKLQGILNAGGYLSLTLGAACVVALSLTALFTEAARRWCAALSRLLPQAAGSALHRFLDSFLNGMQSTGSAGSAIRLLLYTAAEWAVIVASMFALLHSFGPTRDLGWTDCLVFTGFVAFGGAVQLPGIGGGMQVAAVLVLTELFGLTLEAASAFALLVWAFSWLSVVPFGLALAFREGIRWSALRRVHETAEVREAGLA